jgi:hypothetical protein
MPFRENADFEQFVDDYTSDYASGREDWFRHFDANATVYPISSTEPFKGRAAYEDNFRNLLKEKRQVEVLTRDIQVMDDTAVAMQLLKVTQSQVATIFRESTIWKQGDGVWKIIHMHTSQVGPGAPAEIPRDARTIKVLVGKIATTSVQVGVAQ